LNDETYHGKDAIKKYLTENPSAKDELSLKLREKLLDYSEENEKVSETEDADRDPTEVIISPDSTDEDEIAAVVA
jgi:recombination protein RecA